MGSGLQKDLGFGVGFRLGSAEALNHKVVPICFSMPYNPRYPILYPLISLGSGSGCLIIVWLAVKEPILTYHVTGI